MKISTTDSLSSKENIGFPKNFIRIFGPCSAESEAQLMELAKGLKPFQPDYFRAGIWKPRTRPDSFEGLGDQALPWLSNVRETWSIPICTEVATPQHVEAVLKADMDAVWLGARTVVSPFMVQELAEALRGVKIPIFIKNPINPDVNLWNGAIERIVNTTGNEDIIAIHRGFSTYNSDPYRNSPMWDIPIELRRRLPELKIICDASHIAGKRSWIPMVVQSAINLAFDGLMLEVHPNPEEAWSDPQQQLTIPELQKLLSEIEWKNTAVENPEILANIEALRYDIDQLDDELLNLLSQRMDVVREIGKYKKDSFATVLQMERWKRLFEKRIKKGEVLHLSSSFIADLMQCIHQEAIRQQNGIINDQHKN